MTGTASSPFTAPIPIPGGTATTSPSPFVTEVKDDIADVEHAAETVEHDAKADVEAAEHEGEHVFSEVKDEAEKVFTEVKTDVENVIHSA